MKPLIFAAWMLFICVGFTILWKYQTRPGDKDRAPAVWPDSTAIVPVAEKYNLVLSLHPYCPCSNATVEELNKLLAHTGSSMHVHVLSYKPSAESEQWAKTSLSDSIRELPNMSVITDVDGKLAQRFGAFTSGDVQLFSPDGRLLFHGGITHSRGHAGDNAGSAAILGCVNGQPCSMSETSVFGCPIRVREGLK